MGLTRQLMRPVSVVVPTLNEVDNLPILFKRIRKTLVNAKIPYEIVVVDDHSTDGTVEYVKKQSIKYNARLLTKQGQRGKAFSLLEGFSAAKYEIVCMIDADLQYPPEAIKLMYHKMQYLEADIVITNRLVNKTSWLRKLTSYGFNFVFTRMLFGIGYDTQSGLKLFRKEVLQSMSLSPSPWTFDLEFIVRALENNYVITSQDIVFSERLSGAPKIKLLDATLEIASGSLKLWRETSTRHVKLRYKYLEDLHSKTLGALVFVMSLVGLLGLSPPKISALALPSSNALSSNAASVSSLVKEATSSTKLNQTTKSSNKAVAATSSTSSASTPAATVIPSSTPSSSETTDSTTAPSNDSSAQSGNTDPTKSGSTHDQATYDTNDEPISSDTSPNAATPSKTSTTSSGQNNGGDQSSLIYNDKQPTYYQNKKLSTHTTSSLITIVKYLLAAAGILLIIGIIIIGIDKWLRKTQHHQLLRS
jgi:dolichol-phosphate mannosyltransferase